MAAPANQQLAAAVSDAVEELQDFDFSDPVAPVVPAPTNVVSLKSSIPATLAALNALPTDLEAFYKPMDKAQVEQLQAVASRIKERDKAARAGIIETGNDLVKIKTSIPGHFDRWLKLEFDMSKATAWNYINAAQQFGSAPKVVEALPPSTVYKLAAKATPAEVRNR
ncbi:hypothetical protein N185_10720 [Sinorhizobium sp. GW3]|nr:hypothetical protein N185_10720 [Sinorhizobium sp. GW3]